jgi:Arc/MetJ-type ribon-helix-helix transcriptional regulator
MFLIFAREASATADNILLDQHSRDEMPGITASQRRRNISQKQARATGATPRCSGVAHVIVYRLSPLNCALSAVSAQPYFQQQPTAGPLDYCLFPSIYHPRGWLMDGSMSNNVRELRPKPADSEKITINLGYIDLGHVDLMVQEGFYSNRTDFIRTAIRNQLERHADVVRQSTARKSLDLGLRNYSREDLETVRRAGEMLHINVLGLATIAQDVTPELARATIASVSVLGALHASPAVRAALTDRMR